MYTLEIISPANIASDWMTTTILQADLFNLGLAVFINTRIFNTVSDIIWGFIRHKQTHTIFSVHNTVLVNWKPQILYTNGIRQKYKYLYDLKNVPNKIRDKTI